MGDIILVLVFKVMIMLTGHKLIPLSLFHLVVEFTSKGVPKTTVKSLCDLLIKWLTVDGWSALLPLQLLSVSPSPLCFKYVVWHVSKSFTLHLSKA